MDKNDIKKILRCSEIADETTEKDRTENDLLREGVEKQLQGDVTEARRRYSAVLEENPDNATALNNLGFTYSREGRYNEAISYF